MEAGPVADLSIEQAPAGKGLNWREGEGWPHEVEASIYSLAEVWEPVREVSVLCKVAPAPSLGGTHVSPPL